MAADDEEMEEKEASVPNSKSEKPHVAVEASLEASAHRRHEKPTVATRGVPSDETLYLPAHDSPALRAFQDKNESLTRNLWNLNEVVGFVFPAKYQPVYNQIAAAFLAELVRKTRMEGEDIAAFVNKQNISKATFYNRVLPRLKHVGMIKVERHTIVAAESKRKFRPMTIHLSKTFGNYLVKIGDSWLALVDDARSQFDQQKKLGQFEAEKKEG